MLRVEFLLVLLVFNAASCSFDESIYDGAVIDAKSQPIPNAVIIMGYESSYRIRFPLEESSGLRFFGKQVFHSDETGHFPIPALTNTERQNISWRDSVEALFDAYIPPDFPSTYKLYDSYEAYTQIKNGRADIYPKKENVESVVMMRTRINPRDNKSLNERISEVGLLNVHLPSADAELLYESMREEASALCLAYKPEYTPKGWICDTTDMPLMCVELFLVRTREQLRTLLAANSKEERLEIQRQVKLPIEDNSSTAHINCAITNILRRSRGIESKTHGESPSMQRKRILGGLDLPEGLIDEPADDGK